MLARERVELKFLGAASCQQCASLPSQHPCLPSMTDGQVAGPGLLPFSCEKAEPLGSVSPRQAGGFRLWAGRRAAALGVEQLAGFKACVDKPSLLGNPASPGEGWWPTASPGRAECQLILSKWPGKASYPSSLLLPSFSSLRLVSGEVETSEALLHECIPEIPEWVYW